MNSKFVKYSNHKTSKNRWTRKKSRKQFCVSFGRRPNWCFAFWFSRHLFVFPPSHFEELFRKKIAIKYFQLPDVLLKLWLSWKTAIKHCLPFCRNGSYLSQLASKARHSSKTRETWKKGLESLASLCGRWQKLR